MLHRKLYFSLNCRWNFGRKFVLKAKDMKDGQKSMFVT